MNTDCLTSPAVFPSNVSTSRFSVLKNVSANGSVPHPGAVRAREGRYNSFSLMPKSAAAGAAASALNSFGYTRRSLSFFPIFFSCSVVLFVYLYVYQIG
jgi:hypothetical protein